MFVRWFYCLLFFSLIPSAFAEPSVRILIDELSGPVSISMLSAHNAYLDGAFWYSQNVADTRSLQASSESLYFDGQAIGRRLRFEPVEQHFSWNNQRYRGSIEFLFHEGKAQVINIVDIEDYLKGVIAVEMKADWPMDALKAQAVASRTYVLAHLNSGANYDICATPGCQHYGGMDVEHPRGNEAVRLTQGVVVMYNGDFAETYYHADSGGIIASSEEVWGNAFPYLVAHNDTSYTTGHRNWVVSLDANLIAQSLNNIGQTVGQVSAAKVLRQSASGRALELQIIGSAGSTVLKGRTLRAFTRAWGLKSTKFVMTANLSAQGNGYGHGVGMSQYGANELAKSGYEFTQILGFYYPGTSLQRLGYAVASVD